MEEISVYSVYRAYMAAKKIARDGKCRYCNEENFEKKFDKMQLKQKEKLVLLTKMFVTVYQNIDVNRYMELGFELWKKFTYNHFGDERLLNYYIQKDKNRKLEISTNKKLITASAKFIIRYCQDNDIKSLKEYCRKRENFKSIPVVHYIHGNIDNILMTYLIYKRYILLDEDDKQTLTFIVERFRTLKANMFEIIDFLEELEDLFDEI